MELTAETSARFCLSNLLDNYLKHLSFQRPNITIALGVFLALMRSLK